MKHVLAFVTVLVVFRVLEAGKSSGPVGTLNLDSVYYCADAPTGDDFNIQVDLKTDGHGTKTLSGHLENTVALDPTIQHLLKVEKYADGDGWKDYYTMKGLFCDDVLKYLGKVWTMVKKSTNPPPSPLHPCLIEKGKHDLVDFKCTTQDLGMPTIFYGKFRVKWELLHDGKRIACLQGEGESIAP